MASGRAGPRGPPERSRTVRARPPRVSRYHPGVLAAVLAAALAAAAPVGPGSSAPTAARPPGAAGARVKPERIALAFAWPPGREGTCEWSHAQLRAGKPFGGFAVRFKVSATAEGEGARIEKTPLALPAPEGGIARAVADLWPGSEVFLVDGRGRFARYEELDAAVDAMDGALAPVTGDLDAASRERISEAAREALPRRARDEWSPWVGFWAGARLDLGVPRVEEIAGAGTRSRARLEYRADGRVPCAAGGPPGACVRLVLRTTWTDAAGAPGVGARGTPLAYEEESVLVTDPATLLPRLLERRRVGRVEGAVAPALEKRWTIRCAW
jgi:hypothetical protein